MALAACGLAGLGGCAAGGPSDGTVTSGTPGPHAPPGRQHGGRTITLRGTVSRVVDGDTIRVVSRGFDTVVRLVGIDTPETRRPGEIVQCFGPEATAQARRLLPLGTAVRLETDPTQAVRDRYDRLLAYVYTGGAAGPAGSVNYALVASGHAKVYVYGGTPFRFTAEFRTAQMRARRLRLGLWGPPCGGDTTKPEPA